jgi:pimeloyl-ACP methyl ester carboxylesterase
MGAFFSSPADEAPAGAYGSVLAKSLIAHLTNNISLPYSTFSSSDSLNTIKSTIIFGHGLGSKNPKKKNHSNDEWTSTLTFPVTKLPELSVVAYTARGHGDSHGWEDSASSDPDQFTWRRLADDMIAMSEYVNVPRFIASGSSMGSATALFCASIYPERVQALIMIRPPTAWEQRAARRKNLLSSANKCKERHPNEPHYLVLEGATKADLPPLHDVKFYENVRCPVLILTIKGDEAHPVYTAEKLKEMIPHAILYIAEDDIEAKANFPIQTKAFLENICKVSN